MLSWRAIAKQRQLLALLWLAAANPPRDRRSVSDAITLNSSSSSSNNEPQLAAILAMPTPRNTTAILAAIRQLMAAAQPLPLAAYIVPSDDAHQSEYISAHDERRRFCTGFDGSAGTAVITAQAGALLWTDGRYYAQATQQMDANWRLMRSGLPETPEMGQWLAQTLRAGDAVGADPRLMPTRTWQLLAGQLAEADVRLQAVAQNLVDEVWAGEQPAQTSNAVIALPAEVVGQTVGDKVAALRAKMRERRAEVLVVTALDEVAWLLNLRGSDIDYNPVFFAYIILPASGPLDLFIDPAKLPADYVQHFARNEATVRLHPYAAIDASLAEHIASSEHKVWLALGSSYAFTALVPEARRLQDCSPIAALKAVKNEAEVAGMRAAHVRDGVALCRYFAWLEAQVAGGQPVDEISGAARLDAFRARGDHFKGLSFPTISASGPNAAIIHYHPEVATNRPITASEMYLCDSGAQYLDGTTDVTRTWHFGEPSSYQRECFTRVLQGQMGLGAAVFPAKLKGQFLDTLARKALWDVGLDYAHGTGHGIGHFLNVHEGPMGISFRVMPDDPGLQANMFVSNEPGYYEDGAFGIRIEDIVQIVAAGAGEVRGDFGGRGALRFHTVTLCPIQTKLVLVEMLSAKEREYLNGYHERVWRKLSLLLQAEEDANTLRWLRRQTEAI